MPTATPNNSESVDEVEDFTNGHVITYHIYKLLLFSPKSLCIHKSINEFSPLRNQTCEQRELSRPRSNVIAASYWTNPGADGSVRRLMVQLPNW